ncbi:hypothetical protein QE422_001380 [Chryseobacterium sp. SORGH_AS 447]|uniref:WbqC family protein n=1 Tax=Chryseobacterium sp. SORGH_AS_0447 TaxID=3041769 RepID=UPI0027883FCD|nr:WbqC family protein [Chryseobacterium sp. SORGH_AS_0447]MDQ1161012.1 hypothetical protein [Chryseobacterium sp. SORGH_AS_0447]
MKKIAIMQPYFVPYIGYFQMIKAVDVFVFYDDVNFMKSGWVNRNRVLVNNEAKYLTVPLIGSSSNKLINDIEVRKDSKEFLNLHKILYQNYSKAPYFENVLPIINLILQDNPETISQLAIKSIISICEYLKIKTQFKVSSVDFINSKGLKRTERLLDICEKSQADQYINAIGGVELYDKKDFSDRKITLSFIKSQSITYKQFSNDFIPWLSIIDVLVFNSIEEINVMVDQYELI